MSLQREKAVASIIFNLISKALSKEISSKRVAFGSFIGSAEYTPLTLVAFSTASQSISKALTTLAVSVVQNGLPGPPAKITIEPSFKALTAVSRLNFGTMPSTAKGDTISKIVPKITDYSAVTTTRNDVNYIVTEFGVAQLKGKSMRERARALISIAHPNFREELCEEFERRFNEKF